MLFIVITCNVRIEERMNIVGSVESSLVESLYLKLYNFQFNICLVVLYHIISSWSQLQVLPILIEIFSLHSILDQCSIESFIEHFISWMNEKNISLMSIMLVLCYSYTCHVTRRVWIEVSVLDWEIWFVLSFIYTFIFNKCFASLIFIVFICFVEEQSPVATVWKDRIAALLKIYGVVNVRLYCLCLEFWVIFMENQTIIITNWNCWFHSNIIFMLHLIAHRLSQS